jgi:hypothetical protein
MFDVTVSGMTDPLLGMAEGLGKETPAPGGSRGGGGGLIVVFATLAELQVLGPIALREYLKRRRRLGGPRGQVVEFDQGGHHSEEA